jgi:large subunit ribosomal protein L9
MVKLFEARRGEIDARKAAKRQDALGIKEKLEALDLVISMPAGANGKLYGAVTSQTVAEEISKQGFPTERKKVELPGNTFKSVGKYKVTVKLYENAAAEIGVTVQAQVIKTETKTPAPPRKARHHDWNTGTEAAHTEEKPAEAEAAVSAIVEAEAPAPEAPVAETEQQ